METDGEKGRTGDDNGYKILRFLMDCLINILTNAGLFDKFVLNITLSLGQKSPSH